MVQYNARITLTQNQFTCRPCTKFNPHPHQWSTVPQQGQNLRSLNTICSVSWWEAGEVFCPCQSTSDLLWLVGCIHSGSGMNLPCMTPSRCSSSLEGERSSWWHCVYQRTHMAFTRPTVGAVVSKVRKVQGLGLWNIWNWRENGGTHSQKKKQQPVST